MATLIHFPKLWSEAKRDIFRLETLDRYVVDEEEEAFEKYKRGEKFYDKEFEGWLKEIKNTVDKSIAVRRVHIVSLPLSEYVRFEIEEGYTKTQKQGEGVFMIDRQKTEGSFEDFWMFDDKIVLPMIYDKDGRFLREGKPIEDESEVKNFVEIKNKLLSKSVPLNDFTKP